MTRLDRQRWLFTLVPVLLLMVVILIIVVGSGRTHRHAVLVPAAAVRYDQGIPVGVLDTPVGAMAAARAYVIAEQEALPTGIDPVLNRDWTPEAAAADRRKAAPPAAFQGMQVLAAVGASKLVWFSRQAAVVVLWHVVVGWDASNPSQQPATQRWDLDTVTLGWQNGQWLITNRSSAPDSQIPVPQSSQSGNDTGSSAFQELQGFSVG